MAVLVLAGCASGGGDEGDCTARIRFEGSLYRSHSAMPDRAPLGSSAGRGEVVGCGGLDAPAVDRVEVHRIEGVAPEVAVGTRGDWPGLYIREDLASERSSWPEPLRP
ncbi:hypothetical protein ACLIYP_18225 [Streptomyces nanhaiensis]|uniref:hypothetical protein n=1 Tax=Streptomyces nanhaiensis TaxID=679319 RepID=UPI00399C510E